MSEIADLYNENYHNNFKQMVEENKQLKAENEELKKQYNCYAGCDFESSSRLRKEYNLLKQQNKKLKQEVKEIGHNFILKGDMVRVLLDKLLEIKLKLKEINEIAHWRMDEVDIHLKNRLSKIQELSK